MPEKFKINNQLCSIFDLVRVCHRAIIMKNVMFSLLGFSFVCLFVCFHVQRRLVRDGVSSLSLFQLKYAIVKIQGVGVRQGSSVFDMFSCKYSFDGNFHFLSTCCVRNLFCFQDNLWNMSGRESLSDGRLYPGQQLLVKTKSTIKYLGT